MSKAFVYDVHENTSDSHQVSPAWMLTFVRWVNRNPENYTNPGQEGNFAVTKPLIVTSDCVSLTVNSSKSSHTPSMTAMLKSGDLNYLTAIAPGDFVFVNIADWEETIDHLKQNAEALKPINNFHDGFKGIFKVQSVRRVTSVNPETGTKQLMFQIDGYGFTEFNNMIYFNSHLIPSGGDKSFLFVTNLSKYWHSLFAYKTLPPVQEVVSFFIKTFLGEGAPSANINKTLKEIGNENTKINYNNQFLIPSGVGKLLGQKDAKAAKDLYIYLMGIQSYSVQKEEGEKELNFVPSNLEEAPRSGRFFYTKDFCQGRAIIKPDYWNQVPVWSIMNEYVNAPINEIYTCYRVAPNGSVMPTLVMRQMPFSSEKFKGIGTKFLNLPRWKISPNLIYDINLGRDEALRINFVQVFGYMGGAANPKLSISYQIAKGNFVYDEEDIVRSGLRPYVVSSNFDIPQITAEAANSKVISSEKTNAFAWAEMLGDCLIGSHLKMSGTISCVGIEYPIAPGDNLELGDTVYHIESVSHTAYVQPGGERVFRTNIEVSHGVSKHSNNQKTIYPQMTNSKIELEQQEDVQRGDEILPGISSSNSDTLKNNESFDLPPNAFGRPQKVAKDKKTKGKVSK